MKTYTVSWSELCPVCDGARIVPHPAWAAFWAAHPDDRGLDDAVVAQYMNEAGWQCQQTLHVTQWGSNVDHGLPQEEIICGECDGTGTLTGTCDLKTALADLNTQTELD